MIPWVTFPLPAPAVRLLEADGEGADDGRRFPAGIEDVDVQGESLLYLNPTKKPRCTSRPVWYVRVRWEARPKLSQSSGE